MFRYRLRTLMILLAVAVLVATGVLRLRSDRGLWSVKRGLDRVVPQIERRDAEIQELAKP